MPCLSLRSAVLVALLCGASVTPSIAASVNHNGAEQPATPLSTYGMQVDAERALRSNLPDGWQLTVAPGTELSGKVSWGPKDTWLEVLTRVSERSDVDVTVDWDAQAIIVEAATRAVKPQESTPELAVKAESSSEGVSVSSEVAAKSAAASSIEIAPLKAPEVSKPVEVKPTVSAAGPAQAFNRTHLRVPFEALAEYHGLELIYEAGDVALPGPVTLLFDQGLDTDIELLDRAFGRRLPLEIIHYKKERQLIVREAPRFTFASFDARPVPPVKRSLFARIFRPVPTSQELADAESQASLAALSQVELPPTPVTPIEAPSVSIDPVLVAEARETQVVKPVATEAVAPVASLPHVAPPVPAETVEVTAPAVVAPTAVTLELAQGERLSSAIKRLLENQGWALVWRANVDLEAATPTRVEGVSFADILEQILPQFGLSADLYNPSRTVVIRTPQNSASQGTP